MLFTNILAIIVWLVVGVLVSIAPKVDKFAYFLCWITLFFYLIKDVITSL